MVLFVLYVILTLEYIDKILRYDHSNESSLAVLHILSPLPCWTLLGLKGTTSRVNYRQSQVQLHSHAQKSSLATAAFTHLTFHLDYLFVIF